MCLNNDYSLQAHNDQNSECCDELQFDYLEMHTNTFGLYLMLTWTKIYNWRWQPFFSNLYLKQGIG